MSRSLIGLSLIFIGVPALAQDVPSLEAMWEIIQRQELEIADLRSRLVDTTETLEVTNERVDDAEQMVVATSDYIETIDLSPPTRNLPNILGYGEAHYNNLSADDPSRDLDQVDFHRFVVFFGNQFNDRVSFFSELEIEHSVAGDGKPGEV